ncbi:MAG: polysaccharide biosynthesis C-terminal domain-containing protein, partial [Oscillospiraceae bacterium]|nr:polysaccharide biosynthesis C-terminal domain-containing protein [Oscillospiraceae bacterium]
DAWIVCEEKQKYLTRLYFGAAVTNVVLNALLIPALGADGAAWASLITQISTILVFPSLIKALRPNVKLMIDAFLLRNLK